MGTEQVVETDDVFEIIWHIPLNANASKITKVERYMKDGSIVEGQRRDGRPGVLRSQLTFTQDGTPHIRFASFASPSRVLRTLCLGASMLNSCLRCLGRLFIKCVPPCNAMIVVWTIISFSLEVDGRSAPLPTCRLPGGVSMRCCAINDRAWRCGLDGEEEMDVDNKKRFFAHSRAFRTCCRKESGC